MALNGQPRLALFDIDGTLLSIAERELNVFGLALEEVYGTSGPIEGYSFAGKTDHQITYDLLTGAGKEASDIESRLDELQSRYFEMLEEMLELSNMVVLPGVVELLDELSADSTVILGLQTGNWEVAAEIKLSRHDLVRYFKTGAFGDGHLDRNALPPLARRRAESRLGREISPRDTIVIGDTALDVACAHQSGMVAVGVATGSASESDLSKAGADMVVSTLSELNAESLLNLASGAPS